MVDFCALIDFLPYYISIIYIMKKIMFSLSLKIRQQKQNDNNNNSG